MTGLWLEKGRRWAPLLPADTALRPCAALSPPCGCARALGRHPNGPAAARLHAFHRVFSRSLPLLSAICVIVFFCLLKALNRLAGKEELCQSLSSDASRINCRDWLRRCCKGGEGPGLERKSQGAMASGPSYQGGAMGSESRQDSPDGAQKQCWALG